MSKYIKAEVILTLEQFLDKASKVESFTSSRGRRYQVEEVLNDIMFFRRLDSDGEIIWDLDLRSVYVAYTTLDNFDTISFKPYVPIMHSPARGLLLHLEMLK
jgi:hypothetical protein